MLGGETETSERAGVVCIAIILYTLFIKRNCYTRMISLRFHFEYF